MVDEGEGQVPDPLTCTHAEWTEYVRSVDVMTMTGVEAAEYRRRFEAYTARLQREAAVTHESWVQRLDERDRTAQAAEDLSRQCRELQGEVLAAGATVLRLHNELGPDHELVAEARRAQSLLNDQLVRMREQLRSANVAAEDARTRSQP